MAAGSLVSGSGAFVESGKGGFEERTMSKHIKRPIKIPIRNNPSFEERWLGPDKGLITCWEVGRGLLEKNPDLALQAKCGVLPVLGWKGGVEKGLKIKKKYGTLNYLAQWKGLRGEDLDIYLDKEYTLTCEKTGVQVIFSANSSKSE